MRLEEMILASVDAHVVEPPDLFDRHRPARCKARALDVRRLPDGIGVWVLEKRPLADMGLNAVVGRRSEEYGVEPNSCARLASHCATKVQ